MRFLLVREGKLDFLRKLVIEFSRYLLNNSIADNKLQFNFNEVTPVIKKNLDDMECELVSNQVQYKLIV